MSDNSAKPPRQIMAALAMTHTPGLGDRLEEPPQEQIRRLMTGFAEGRRVLSAAKPELVIAFINDHFDMYCMNNMPTFSIGIADEHFGPPADAEAWLKMKRRRFAGHAGYAMEIHRDAIAAGFDVTRSGTSEFVHNMLMPVKYIGPEDNVPIVPIFINCFSPPLPGMRRCYDFGRTVGQTIARRPERVALIASGGISHWPPFAKEDSPPDDELATRMLRVQRLGPTARREDPGLRNLIHEREAEMAASGRELINVAWDRAVLAAFERGDAEHFFRMNYDEIEQQGGNGGHEIAMWVAVMGALDGAPMRTIVYEPVTEWMGGVGLSAYQRSGESTDRHGSE